MKKLLLYVCILLMFACTERKDVKSPEQMMQEEALIKMDSLIRDGISDPNVTIENVKTMFESDSAIVVHCTIRFVNKFGGYNKQKTEYVFGFARTGEKKHYLSDINDYEVIIKDKKLLNELDGGNTGIDSIQHIKNKIMQSLDRYGLAIE